MRAALLLLLVSRVAVADDAALPPAAVAEAIAKRDPAAPRGVGKELAVIAKTAPGDHTAVRDALVAKGLAIVDAHDAPRPSAC